MRAPFHQDKHGFSVGTWSDLKSQQPLTASFFQFCCSLGTSVLLSGHRWVSKQVGQPTPVWGWGVEVGGGALSERAKS